MRRFIVVGHRAVTSADFNLSDLSSSAGRLDILARAVSASFFLSHGIRKDVVLYLLLLGEPSPPKSLRFVGSDLKYLNPDERSTAALIRNALSKCGGEEKVEWLRSTPGISISTKNLKCILEECKPSTFYYLKESGYDFKEVNLSQDSTFVLGDDSDLNEEEEKILDFFNPTVLSLGPLSLHKEHCITLVHNKMDREHIQH